MDDRLALSRAGSTGELSRESAEDIEIVARGGAAQVAGQVVHRSLSFFFNLLAFRILGAAGFGVYRVVTQVLAIAGEIGTLGFHYATLRFSTIGRARQKPDEVLGAFKMGLTGASLAAGATAAVSIVLAGPLGAAFGDSPTQDRYLTFLMRIGAAYIPCFALMQVFRYATQSYKTMAPSVIAGHLVQPIVGFGLGAGLLALGMSVTGAISGLIVGSGVAALVGAMYLRRLLTEEERGARPRRDAKAMLLFALPQAGSLLLSLQTLGLGVLLLGAWSSSRQVGLFAAALALQGPAGVFQAGTVSIWAPMVADLHERNEKTRLEDLYKTLTRWIATFSLPISAALLIHSELFARMFGGDEAADAAPVVAVLALGNIFATTLGPSVYLLTMTGRPGINFTNSVAAVIVYAGAGWFVVKDHGALGVAWVDAAVTAALALTRVVQVRRYVGVQPFDRSLLKPAVSTAVGAGSLVVLLRVLPGSLVWEIAALISAAAVYLACRSLLGFDREERYLWDLLKRKVRRGD